MSSLSRDLITALITVPDQRTEKDITTICRFLRTVDNLSSLRIEPLKSIAKSVRYEVHLDTTSLYSPGHGSSCWYILLSGSVFTDGRLIPVGQSFGKRSTTDSRQCRQTECIVVQKSEMIAIDYPDAFIQTGGGVDLRGRKNITSLCDYSMKQQTRLRDLSLDDANAVIEQSENYLSSLNGPISGGQKRCSLTSSTGSAGTSRHQRSCSRGSSDNSSLHSIGQWNDPFSSGASHHHSGSPRTWHSVSDDFDGLPENPVDSDEEDDISSTESFTDNRDSIRECLELEPSQRTPEDVQVLFDFMQHMVSFASLPHSIKRELCEKMVFAVVDRAGYEVMQHGEKLDSWVVIVNGEVVVDLPDGSQKEFRLGQSFGVEPVLEDQFHVGVMRTLVDDCQFVLVAQEDYVDIKSRISEALKKHRNTAGEIVSETERRIVAGTEGFILVKAKPDNLINYAIDEPTTDKSIDPHFLEDFLLTYRTYIFDPVIIMQKLLDIYCKNYESAEMMEKYQNKVHRVVSHWVLYHYHDFELNPRLLELLEEYKQDLERGIQSGNNNKRQYYNLLNCHCSMRSHPRTLILSRSDYSDPLYFTLRVSSVKEVFVESVEKASQAEKIGLKPADCILEVNGQPFMYDTEELAVAFLKKTTHLSMTVKHNPMGYSEAVNTGPSTRDRYPNAISVKNQKQNSRISVMSNASDKSTSSTMTASISEKQTKMGHLQSIVNRWIPKSSSSLNPQIGDVVDASVIGSAGVNFDPSLSEDKRSTMRPPPTDGVERSGAPPTIDRSQSNPDLSVNDTTARHRVYAQRGGATSDQYDNVIKVYRDDQTFKFLPIMRHTTAAESVKLLTHYWGIATTHEPVNQNQREIIPLYCLCEVSVVVAGDEKKEKHLRCRRLPDHQTNLAERIPLNARYYLKNKHSSEPLVPSEKFDEILAEAQISLLDLQPDIIACQITLQHFAVFSAIESTEFVDKFFVERPSPYGCPKLNEFERRVDLERWWVATEILSEKNLAKRVRLLKMFIKLAKYCKDFKNFDTCFAIHSGLTMTPVERLTQTWQKLPSKYAKIFDDLKKLVDPSKNFGVYRSLLRSAQQEPPVIPFFPVVTKDLFFYATVNPTISEGLVNIDKLRSFSDQVRLIKNYTSRPFELHSLSQISNSDTSKYTAVLTMNAFDLNSSSNDSSKVATMKKHQRSVPINLSRKRLYEVSLMVRRVKSYLAERTVITDDSVLALKATECEGTAVSLSSAGASRGRLPSPSPSSGSSLSNQSNDVRRHVSTSQVPKFGTNSPNDQRKILSLADSSRQRAADRKLQSMSPGHSPVAPRRQKLRPSVSTLQHQHSAGPVLCGNVTTIGGGSSVTPSFFSHVHHHPPSSHSSSRNSSESVTPSTPVGLTPELSSVLGNPVASGYLHPGGSNPASTCHSHHQWKSKSNGSVTSHDSGSSLIAPATSVDSTDSGHASMDTYSNGRPSPPSVRNSFPSTQGKYASSSTSNGAVSYRKPKAPPIPNGPLSKSRSNGAPSHTPLTEEDHQISRV